VVDGDGVEVEGLSVGERLELLGLTLSACADEVRDLKDLLDAAMVGDVVEVLDVPRG